MLSRQEILRHRDEGNIVIWPFTEAHVGTNSLDITLGEWVVRPNPSFRADAYCPYNSDHLAAYWQPPERAIDREKLLARWPNFAAIIGDLAGPFILLPPGTMFLGHSREFVGGQNCIATKLAARSRVARNGVEICACASHGDIGFVNRWVFELYNKLNRTVVLPVGMRIGQIEFFETSSVTDRTINTIDDLVRLEAAWSPQMMLGELSAEPGIRRIQT